MGRGCEGLGGKSCLSCPVVCDTADTFGGECNGMRASSGKLGKRRMKRRRRSDLDLQHQ